MSQLELKTTIIVDTATRLRIRALGSKGETYDDVLKRILDFYEKSHKIKVAGVD